MLRDMLEPPAMTTENRSRFDETKGAAEHAAASIDEAMDPIEASEERDAAMEMRP